MISVVQKIAGSTNFGGSNAAHNSYTLLPVVGNSAIVVVRTRDNSGGYAGVVGVADNQGGLNVYVKVINGIGSTVGCPDCEIWWCPSIVTSAGTFTVTATLQASASQLGFVDLIEGNGITGVDQIGSLVDNGTAAETATATAGGANTGTGNLVVCGIYLDYNGGTNGLSNPPTSGYTSLGFNDSGETSGSAYKIDTGSGQTDSATWAWTSVALGYGGAIATFKGVPAAPATPGFIRQPGPGIGPDSRYQFSTIVRDASVPPISASANILEGYDTIVATAGQISGSAAILEPLDIISAAGVIINVAVTGPDTTWDFSDSLMTFDNPAFTFDGFGPGLVEGLDIVQIAASVGAVGTAAILEGNDILAATANIAATATANIHENADILAFAASTGIVGSASILEGRDGISAQAAITTVAVASIVEGLDLISAVSQPITAATANIVEGLDIVSGTAQVAWVASAAIVEGLDIPAIFGSGSTVTANILEGLDSIVASATTQITAGASIAEGTDTLVSTGISSISASASILEAFDYLASALTAVITGSVNVLEGFDSVVIAAVVSPTQFSYADVIALSQTGIQGVRSAYIENSACYISAAYFNAARNPMVPASVQYRVDDVVSGQNLVPWTQIAPNTINEVTITSLQNGMVSYTRASEVHQVLFQIIDSFGTVAYARCLFDIVRVDGFPVPDIIVGSANILESSDVIVAAASHV